MALDDAAIQKNNELYSWRLRVAKKFAALHPADGKDEAFVFAVNQKAMIRQAFADGRTKDEVLLDLIDLFFGASECSKN